MNPVLSGLMISFLAIVFGTGLGMIFGVNEDNIKAYFLSEVKAHPDIHEQTPANILKQVTNSWRPKSPFPRTRAWGSWPWHYSGAGI